MSNIPTPASADLNKLKSILGNAKAIINKDNSSVPNRGGNGMAPQRTQQAPQRDGYGPGTNMELMSEQDMLRVQQMRGQGQPQIQGQSMGDPTRKPGPVTEDAIRNSNMPDAIKKMMLENPISQPTINHTFNLDDVSDLIEDRPAPQAYQPQPVRQPQQRMNEGTVMKNSNDTFTVSETALRGIIKDVLVEYLAADYSKSLTEATIKKTINTLIKEGKIKTKPKR